MTPVQKTSLSNQAKIGYFLLLLIVIANLVILLVLVGVVPKRTKEIKGLVQGLEDQSKQRGIKVCFPSWVQLIISLSSSNDISDQSDLIILCQVLKAEKLHVYNKSQTFVNHIISLVPTTPSWWELTVHTLKMPLGFISLHDFILNRRSSLHT